MRLGIQAAGRVAGRRLACLDNRLHESLRVLGGALHRLGKVVQRLAGHARALVVVHVGIQPACATRIPSLLLCTVSQLSLAAFPGVQLCSAKASVTCIPAKSSTCRCRVGRGC